MSSTDPPRFLMLCGSLRERCYSKPPDRAPETHPKVQALRDAVTWAEGMVWTSPEQYLPMTGIMKAQIDWIPLKVGTVRPTQGKTLAVMEVSGGSHSA